MAAGRFVVPPYFPARNRDFDLLSGAKLYVYDNLTTDKANIYTDEALTVLSANPVIANSSGQFPAIWAQAGTEAEPVLYSVSVTTSTGASPGNPFNFDNYRPSVDWETAAAALAEAAAALAVAEAAAAAISADEAAADAVLTAADLAAIEAIIADAPDAPSVLNKLNRNGDNASAGLLAAIGEQTPDLTAITAPIVDSDILTGYRSGFKRFTASVFADYIKAFFSASGGSALLGFLQAGTGAVARTAQAKMRDVVCVKDFGAVGDGVTDDTAAMLAAHATGQTVYYPRGTYQFTKITIPCGGIIGDGKLTILRTTDTSSDDLIVYTSVDPTGLLINTVGGLFQNFTLMATTPSQKAAGAGISIIPANYSGSSNEDYLTILSGLYIHNIPIGASFKKSSYFTVRDSYFAMFSVAGIYAEIDEVLFQDNGDNAIIGNNFFVNGATAASARGIWYRTGGARIIGNKINGGAWGVDINPLRGTSIAVISANSVENQTINAIRAYIGSDFTPLGANDGFSFVMVEGNQIGGYNLAGGAISIDAVSTDPRFYSCSVSNNVIYNPSNTASAAIDIRRVDRFSVTDNLVDSVTLGYGGLFIASSANDGFVSGNKFVRSATLAYQNSSTTTTFDQVVGQYSATINPPSIAAGATYTFGDVVPGAALGDYVQDVSFAADLQEITLTAYVAGTDIVTFVFFNGTAGAIDLGAAALRCRVVTK